MTTNSWQLMIIHVFLNHYHEFSLQRILYYYWGCLVYPKSHIIHAEIAETAEMALPVCDFCVKFYQLVWIVVAMSQYDFQRPETKSPKDWKTTDGGATPVHVVDKPKPWKGDRQSAARILSPLRGSVLSLSIAQGLHPCLYYVVPVGDFLPLWLSAAWDKKSEGLKDHRLYWVSI